MSIFLASDEPGLVLYSAELSAVVLILRSLKLWLKSLRFFVYSLFYAYFGEDCDA